MAIDFPNTPSVNDVYSAGGKSWAWNGTAWVSYANNPAISTADTAPGSPINDQMWFESDTGKLYIRYDGNWIEIGQATDVGSNEPGFRNRIINGGFNVWQRGGGAFTTANSYTADMFKVSSNGSTFSASRQAFTLGNPIPGYEPEYFMRVAVTSVAGASNYVHTNQHIEDVRTFAGQTCTISFWAKADFACNMGLELVQNFGTGGSPSAEVNGLSAQLVALTTSWVRKTITVTVPSISGKTLGTDGDFFSLRFWLDSGSTYAARSSSVGQQSRTFDFWGFQVEAGSYASRFEDRPIGIELGLCQRYFWRINRTSNYVTAGTGGVVTSGTTIGRAYIVCPVQMRRNIETADVTYNALRIYDGAAIAAVTSHTLYGGGEDRLLSGDWIASGGGLTAWRPASLLVDNSSGSYFQVSAEL